MTNEENNNLETNLTDNSSKTGKQRKYKGSNIISFPDSYCVIDIETTGLSPAYDSIIEVSAIKVSAGNITETFSSLVQPFSTSNEYVDEFITKLTGITNEMLSSAPKEEDVIPKFKDFIGSSILVGHNINFDINFLYDSFENILDIHLDNDFIDTMRISRKIHNNLPHHRLSDIANLYGIDYLTAHRALEDCKITNSCYILLKKDIINQHESLEAFLKLCKKKNHYRLNAKDIHATTVEFDVTNILYQKVVVFTGALEKYNRKTAMQFVANLGGINADNVTRQTNYLVLGNYDYCSQIKDSKSSKRKKAEQLQLQGYDIEIIPENVFYDMLEEEVTL